MVNRTAQVEIRLPQNEYVVSPGEGAIHTALEFKKKSH